jgi:hypothetical protein
MGKLKKSKFALLSFLLITVLVISACQSENSEEPDVKDVEIIGGPLNEFDSLDMYGNDVDQSIFNDADVNLIFVWAST